MGAEQIMDSVLRKSKPDGFNNSGLQQFTNWSNANEAFDLYMSLRINNLINKKRYHKRNINYTIDK